MYPVEAFSTGIKVESSDQPDSFKSWSRDQDKLWDPQWIN